MAKAGASPSVWEVIIRQKGEWKTIGIFSQLNEVNRLSVTSVLVVGTCRRGPLLGRPNKSPK